MDPSRAGEYRHGVAYKLAPEETVTEGLARCARDQLDRATKALTEEIDADPVVAVHTARKAIKKERALLRLARGSLDNRQRSTENANLRDTARRLAGARDAEVMVQTLDRLSERFAGQLPEATFAAARAPLETERPAEPAAAGDSGVLDAVEELRAIRTRVDSWQLSQDDFDAFAPGLRRSYRDGRRAMRRVRREPSLENLHEWRKRVKDVWYELRLLAPVCGPLIHGAAEEAKHLSKLLGDDHDLGILQEAVTRIAPEVAADLEPLVELAEHRRKQLQTQALLVGERLYAEKPKPFLRRIRGCWSAGRAEFESRDHGIVTTSP